MPTNIKHINYQALQTDFDDEHRNHKIDTYRQQIKTILSTDQIETGIQILHNLNYVNQKCYIDELLINYLYVLHQQTAISKSLSVRNFQIQTQRALNNGKSPEDAFEIKIKTLINQFESQFQYDLNKIHPKWKLDLLCNGGFTKPYSTIQTFINNEKHAYDKFNEIANLPFEQLAKKEVSGSYMLNENVVKNKNERQIYVAITTFKLIQKQALSLLNEKYEQNVNAKLNPTYQKHLIDFNLYFDETAIPTKHARPKSNYQSHFANRNTKKHQNWLQNLFSKSK